jgi:hypothetical protein
LAVRVRNGRVVDHPPGTPQGFLFGALNEFYKKGCQEKKSPLARTPRRFLSREFGLTIARAEYYSYFNATMGLTREARRAGR